MTSRRLSGFAAWGRTQRITLGWTVFKLRDAIDD